MVTLGDHYIRAWAINEFGGVADPDSPIITGIAIRTHGTEPGSFDAHSTIEGSHEVLIVNYDARYQVGMPVEIRYANEPNRWRFHTLTSVRHERFIYQSVLTLEVRAGHPGYAPRGFSAGFGPGFG